MKSIERKWIDDVSARSLPECEPVNVLWMPEGLVPAPSRSWLKAGRPKCWVKTDETREVCPEYEEP